LPLREGSGDPHLEEVLLISPVVLFLDNTGEAQSGLLREGRPGSNTTADHITVLD
jgi:hypothetical protein